MSRMLLFLVSELAKSTRANSNPFCKLVKCSGIKSRLRWSTSFEKSTRIFTAPPMRVTGLGASSGMDPTVTCLAKVAKVTK